MNRTFTINEEIIRRLVLRRDRDQQEHERSRQGHFAPRFWRGLTDFAHESTWFVSRAR